MQRSVHVLAVLLTASAVQAQEITGTYTLRGERRDGGSYSGQVRIHRDGDELVLTTQGTPRPQLRGSATPLSSGCFAFRFPASESGGAGMSDALDELLTTGRRGAAGPERERQQATLYVKPKDGFLAGYLRAGGETIARERYTAEPVSRLTVTALRPSRTRFLPHHPSNNTVELRYRLDPPEAAAEVRVEVSDREGQVVHTEALGEVRDAGEGALYAWDGEVARGYADARRSPYRIVFVARQGEAEARSQPVEVVAVPLLDRAWVVSRDGDGRLSTSSKTVAHDAEVTLAGVVRAIVGGARAADPGRTQRVCYVLDADLVGQQVYLRGVGMARLEAWDPRWGEVRFRWEQVVALGLHAEPYRATQNSRRMTRHGEFTNVVSNGPSEGRWLGRDTLEYEHRFAGFGSGPRQDTTPGTTRYRFDADYADRELRLGDGERPGTPGKRPQGATTAAQAFSGLAPADINRSTRGPSTRVHRISRRGSSPNRLLSFLECYRRVPWIYGSIADQAMGFVGYDCADLVTAAARHAGLTRTGFTNANNLCRRRTRSVGDHGQLRWNETWETVDAQTGEAHPVRVQGGVGDARPGDVVFFDWDSDGKYDHTTVLWDCPSGTVDRATRFVWAHHDATSSDGFYVGTLSELIHASNRERVTMWIRRF